MNPRIESLERMLDGPRDGALLRFSLGNEYLKAGDPAKAGKCFQEAVDRDSQDLSLIHISEPTRPY